jgi:hypothetical protein
MPYVIVFNLISYTIYDVASLMQLPLANTRKLWAIMFDAVCENADTISVIREWLPQAAATEKDRTQALATEAKRCTETLAEYQAAYDRAMRPKTEHWLAEKEAARFDRALKTAKAKHVKAEKLKSFSRTWPQRPDYKEVFSCIRTSPPKC